MRLGKHCHEGNVGESEIEKLGTMVSTRLVFSSVKGGLHHVHR